MKDIASSSSTKSWKTASMLDRTPLNVYASIVVVERGVDRKGGEQERWKWVF